MKDTVLLVTHNGMGSADEVLPKMLIAKYFELLWLQPDLPAAICLYTDGVKLACEGSSVLDQLQKLEAKGVRIILCSTCLNYFNLTDQVKVGIVGSMADILEAQTRAGKVITL